MSKTFQRYLSIAVCSVCSITSQVHPHSAKDKGALKLTRKYTLFSKIMLKLDFEAVYLNNMDMDSCLVL